MAQDFTDEFDPNQVINGPPLPVSEVCPECGRRAEVELRAQPWYWAGLWKDRVCTACRIRFRPPRPNWIIGLYLLSGIVLLTVVTLMLGIRLIPDWNPPWVGIVCPPLGLLAAYSFCLACQLRDT